MTEGVGPDLYNANNILEPLEQGVVGGFDRLFAAREKTLKHWLATQITQKKEFLTRTFPAIITMGAQHPELSGGVLYMLGLVTKNVREGSAGINSIPRRFAEMQSTKHTKDLRPALHEHHIKQEVSIRMKQPESKHLQRPLASTPERQRIVTKEVERARLTRELYDFQKRGVNITGLGKNESLVSILNKDSQTGRTMIFICASGGEPPGVESIAVEYALKTGNKVILIGMPDAASGSITPEFAKAVISDARPPAIDLFRTFSAPTYEAHTKFFGEMIRSLIPHDQHFDLYSYSGGALPAKNLLNTQEFSNRVDNAVFLSPAGVADSYRRFPILFRVMPVLKQLWQSMREFPRSIRGANERDKRQTAMTPDYVFRRDVSRALQDGSHYKQRGWDTMRVNNGKILFYIGKHDVLTGGAKFAKEPFPHAIILDPTGTHGTPLSQPERVLSKIFSLYDPKRNA